MNKLSLFSGIGGDDLASEWAGIKTIAFVERDKFCQSVLRKHWPGIPIIGDVHEVTKEAIAKVMDDSKSGGCGLRTSENVQSASGNVNPSRDSGSVRATHAEELRDTAQLHINASGNQREESTTQVPEPRDSDSPRDVLGRGIDIISGGFPCQPHSVAGKRKGSGDERDLWPEFRRIIGEIRPRWVVAENVPGLFSSDAGRFFGAILSDLAALGYSVGWCTFGAVDVGAWHRRDRVFIVAHTDRTEATRQREHRWQGLPITASDEPIAGNSMADTDQPGLQVATCARIRVISGETRESSWRESCGRTSAPWGIWATEPNVGRVAHGVSRRVDRLRALGNAVVPQQIYPIYKAIAEIER